MKFRVRSNPLSERFAVSSVLFILAVVPLAVWLYGRQHIEPNSTVPLKIFNITGLGSQGRWTLEEVSGYNYWWKSFSRAEIHAADGDSVVLRLQSADVTHVFYAPTLNLGPIYIEPGHVEVVTFRARGNAAHYYYCMSICGECHYFMRGEITIGIPTELRQPKMQLTEACLNHGAAPVGVRLAESGKYLFQRMGCIACHGEAGMGGIINPNYVKNTVPQLNKLSQTLSIRTEEDAEKLWKLIELGKTPEQMEATSTNIPRQSLVLAKYRSVRDVIRNGRRPARADTTSFVPPLAMPAWGEKLSEGDIDAVLVYLLQHQQWEEELP